jgi:hypothetical protein
MIRCREIGVADLDAVADLLTRGFADRSRLLDSTSCGAIPCEMSPKVSRF